MCQTVVGNSFNVNLKLRHIQWSQSMWRLILFPMVWASSWRKLKKKKQNEPSFSGWKLLEIISVANPPPPEDSSSCFSFQKDFSAFSVHPRSLCYLFLEFLPSRTSIPQNNAEFPIFRKNVRILMEFLVKLTIQLSHQLLIFLLRYFPIPASNHLNRTH